MRVRPGAPSAVTLAPRSCGTIAINLLNVANGSRFSVVSGDGAIKLDGALPRDGGIVVPVGDYRVTAQQPLCAPYTNEGVSVAADRTTRLTFRVICEKQ